ncbi:MAG: TetR/AcrR family transcriptional regulator [Sphingobacteriales bacterium]|nr:TetR/AcrR family transcriptional regulator [Sphingobacteriales bacterium]
MATREELENAYIDYVLTNGEKPKSVYIFAKGNGINEAEFYTHFGSFEGIEESVWNELTEKAIADLQSQEIWQQYGSREKILAFFYGYVELLKSKRSFVVRSLKSIPKGFSTPKLLQGSKHLFLDFADAIIKEGIEKSELTDRKFFSEKYKNALWIQFVFILNFWANDNSAGFEKTDEAIEKGINVTFDLFQRTPIDSMLEFGKFIVTNARK